MPTTITLWVHMVWSVAIAVLAAGCHSGMAERYPVHGKVYYQGQALPCGTIVFTPDPNRGPEGALARGEIRDDGSYTLRTEGKPGAAPGWYRITVLAVDMPAHAPAGQRFAEPRALIPERYRDPELAGLTREIQEGKENIIDFQLD